LVVSQLFASVTFYHRPSSTGMGWIELSLRCELILVRLSVKSVSIYFQLLQVVLSSLQSFMYI